VVDEAPEVLELSAAEAPVDSSEDVAASVVAGVVTVPPVEATPVVGSSSTAAGSS